MVPLVAEDDGLHPSLCIICREDNIPPLTSEETGRTRVKRAAALKNDIVTKRIKRLDNKMDDHNGMFSYHKTNKCYKSYTHSGKLKAIEQNISKEPMECETDNGASTIVGFRKFLRRSILPCPPPSCPKDPRTMICVICSNEEHNRNRDKYSICKYGSAERFVNAARHFHDEVSTRVADRLSNNQEECIKSVLSTDLYCHNTCLQSYLRKFDRNFKSTDLV
ncbi:hypothetical protein DPMN_048491 [Dreissena polymorpha]|uniref:Uncharacterized protein n=1 Tax=Dreissena polymorpha TaxID=45954 RepID=A0A9D4DAY8_DREPO|nr:hypothetical protein DPMN_048491 [Dreissena polymorpha]